MCQTSVYIHPGCFSLNFLRCKSLISQLFSVCRLETHTDTHTTDTHTHTHTHTHHNHTHTHSRAPLQRCSFGAVINQITHNSQAKLLQTLTQRFFLLSAERHFRSRRLASPWAPCFHCGLIENGEFVSANAFKALSSHRGSDSPRACF